MQQMSRWDIGRKAYPESTRSGTITSRINWYTLTYTTWIAIFGNRSFTWNAFRGERRGGKRWAVLGDGSVGELRGPPHRPRPRILSAPALRRGGSANRRRDRRKGCEVVEESRARDQGRETAAWEGEGFVWWKLIKGDLKGPLISFSGLSPWASCWGPLNSHNSSYIL